MYSSLRHILLIFFNLRSLNLNCLVSKLFLLTHIIKIKDYCFILKSAILPQSIIINVELNLVFLASLLTISLSFKKLRKADSSMLKKFHLYFYVIKKYHFLKLSFVMFR